MQKMHDFMLNFDVLGLGFCRQRTLVFVGAVPQTLASPGNLNGFACLLRQRGPQTAGIWTCFGHR